MTSNLGNKFIKDYSLGFEDGQDNRIEKESHEKMKDKINEVLEENFKPEFLNRIDEIVVFNVLSEKDIREIVKLQLSEMVARLGKQKIQIKTGAGMTKMLAKKSYDPLFGARPLKRLIQSSILNELAKQIIEGKIKEGDKILLKPNVNETEVQFIINSSK